MVKRIAPDAEIIDLTHGIPPQDVLRGALVLAAALPYAPVGIHVAVVDPGVGSERRALALEGLDGRVYLGPDNGLLLPAVEALGGIARAFELSEPSVCATPVSATFHGRDVFSPAAGQLAQGLALGSLGPVLDPSQLVRLELPRLEMTREAAVLTVIGVDHFGNVQLGGRPDDLVPIDLHPGALVELRLPGGSRERVPWVSTFADAEHGGLLLYVDSSGWLALARREGSAASALALARGARVETRVARP